MNPRDLAQHGSLVDLAQQQQNSLRQATTVAQSIPSRKAWCNVLKQKKFQVWESRIK